MKKVILCFLFLNISLSMFAQALKGTKMKFEDGIYLSHEDLRNNTPSIKKGYYRYEEADGSNFFQKPLSNFEFRRETDMGNINKIWGICIDGIPYINQDNFLNNLAPDVGLEVKFFPSKKEALFTRIAMLGHICILAFEDYVDTYSNHTFGGGNTGALKTMNLKGSKLKAKKYLFDLETGAIENYDVFGLEELIADDASLSFKFKKQKKKKKHIMEYVMAYNQAHPIFE